MKNIFVQVDFIFQPQVDNQENEGELPQNLLNCLI